MLIFKLNLSLDLLYYRIARKMRSDTIKCNTQTLKIIFETLIRLSKLIPYLPIYMCISIHFSRVNDYILKSRI